MSSLTFRGSGRRGHLPCHSRREQSLRIDRAVQLDEPGDQPGPSGLMARAETRAVVAVEVLVEQDVITPVRVRLELLRAAIDGAPALGVPQEDARQARGELAAYLEQVHEFPGAGGALDLEA